MQAAGMGPGQPTSSDEKGATPEVTDKAAASPALKPASCSEQQPSGTATAPALGGPGQVLDHGKWAYFLRSQPPEVRAKLWIDKEASYSVTEERCANAMTEMLQLFFVRDDSASQPRVLDATACVGGNSFSLQKKFSTIACEFDPIRFKMLQSNLEVLGAPVNDPSKLKYVFARKRFFLGYFCCCVLALMFFY